MWDSLLNQCQAAAFVLLQLLCVSGNGEKKHTTLFIGSPKTKGRIKGTHLSTEQLQMLYKRLYATRFSHNFKRHRTSLYIGRKKNNQSYIWSTVIWI